jgi:chromosome segregation ATPase
MALESLRAELRKGEAREAAAREARAVLEAQLREAQARGDALAAAAEEADGERDRLACELAAARRDASELRVGR